MSTATKVSYLILIVLISYVLDCSDAFLPSSVSSSSLNRSDSNIVSFAIRNEKEDVLINTITNHESNQRRKTFLIVGTGIATSWVGEMQQSEALDFDSFINSELSADQVKKDVTEDEKICKYAAPGKDKGEACARAGIKVEGKKRGGVDAYGNIDRGDFVRCKTSYPMIDGKYVKTVTCK